MPLNNPSDKEMLINMSEGKRATVQLFAEGSYLYFVISGNGAFTMARYNIETNQIEQFMDIEKNIYDFVVHNGKIYYTGYLEENYESVVYRYDITSGKNEILLRGENREKFTTSFVLLYGDFDYIYIRRDIQQKIEDYYEGEQYSDVSYLAYTWDGAVAGEILDIRPSQHIEYEALKVIHDESIKMAGSDSDRIYYISVQSDMQIQEDGVTKMPVEGTEKTVISYINKSELSAEAAAPAHIAGEIYG